MIRDKVFTIEPVRDVFIYFLFPMTDAVICKMLNLGSNWSEVHWPDNWTATTVDGKRSAQFEETLLYVTVSVIPLFH